MTHRRVIRIRAEDSPNVQLRLEEIRQGRQPSNRIVIPGVLSGEEYASRRATWDAIRQCIGLDAQFYQGREILLYPPEWLNRAERLADSLTGRSRKAKAIGIDPAEGGDQTAMAVVDEWGLIDLVSKKTPDTSVVTGEALAFMRLHDVPPERVVFDRGGGGKEHADRLRRQGYEVSTVAFGETITMQPHYGMTLLEERIDIKEEKYTYKNRRAQMYGELRLLLDPGHGVDPSRTIVNGRNGHMEFIMEPGHGFCLPAQFHQLRRQLAPIPLLYDDEGRLFLPPKNRRGEGSTGTRKMKSLVEIIGHSPDEADALVLAIYGMRHVERVIEAGAAL